MALRLSGLHFTVTPHTQRSPSETDGLLHCLMHGGLWRASPYGPLLRNECSPTDHR
ncbi:hypothetical protein KCP74_03540 [Salmonella enterica subsp. enterica]|nr:hypothetical protein KCP74_03540 [Salmonella enterica subsp. enterica]